MNFSNLIRKCIAEGLGSFVIVWGGCGAVISDQISGGLLTPVGIGIVFGAIVATMVYAAGHISGAHFNPAVTIAFSVMGHFPKREVLPYVTSQCLGAIAGSGFHFLTLSNSFKIKNYGVTQPFDGLFVTAFSWEMILTFFLMFVIVSVATDSRAIGKIAGMTIGGTVMFEAIFAGPICGASMNPARSLGPAMISGNWSNFWAYVFGPIVGALLGALVYKLIQCSKGENNNVKGCC